MWSTKDVARTHTIRATAMHARRRRILDPNTVVATDPVSGARDHFGRHTSLPSSRTTYLLLLRRDMGKDPRNAARRSRDDSRKSHSQRARTRGTQTIAVVGRRHIRKHVIVYKHDYNLSIHVYRNTLMVYCTNGGRWYGLGWRVTEKIEWKRPIC